MNQKTFLNTILLAAAVALLAPATRLSASTVIGSAYTMTNDASGNAVVVYNRMNDGTLTMVGTVASGGNGAGAGLGSQGAIAINESGKAMLVVNAGSNSVSAFRIGADGTPVLSGTFPSGGSMPISVAIRGRLVYVLNAGTPNTITGFYLEAGPALIQIPNSTLALSAISTTPPQIGISPDANFVVVTEKATNLIDVFPLGPLGRPLSLITNASCGMTPFGFAFGREGRIFISEAFGGAANASAISSYALNASGHLTTITASAPTHQSAACWVALDPATHTAYTTNTQSASLTGFAIAPDGSLTILNSDGQTGLTPPGSQPIDAAVSPEGRFAYALTAALPGITSFRVASTGMLTSVQTVSAPAIASGLAVR